jgi:hypothetical protein
MSLRRFLRNGEAGSAFALWWEERSRPMSAHPRNGQPDAERWRRLEAEARLIGLTMADPERQRVMLFIAEGYKLLAERAELRDTPAK